MLSSVFYIANIPFPRIFYSNISESQSITTVKQIFQFCLHAVYLLDYCVDYSLIYQKNISRCFDLLSLFLYFSCSK